MLEVLDLEVLIPLLQITGFIVMVSLCFLFERNTLGLLIAFIFVYTWGSYVNREVLLELLTENQMYPYIFYGGTFALVVLSGLGVLATRRLK